MKRQGSKKGDVEDKKQRKISKFAVPPSPSSSIASPPSPSSSIASPPSPSSSIASQPSPSSSIASPPSPSSSSNMCFWCEPPSTFNSRHAREEHERQHHSEEKGFYRTPTIADRSQTEALFNKYLPVLPNGIQIQKTVLGIYLLNDKGQIVGAFHMVVSETSVPNGEAARIRRKHSNLFSVEGYAQAHILPASSTRDHVSMYELSFDPMNFEPLNPKANTNVGGGIEDYCQQMKKWGWNVCVFVLLDKTNILGTVTSPNRDPYPISSRWSYLIFMEREEEYFYQAFSFPNGEPTMTYPGYRTSIDEIRSISGLDFQFHMSDSISQYWGRVKKEKYERENPFVCPRSDCNKRFPSIPKLKEHGRSHDPVRSNKQKESYHARRLAKRTSVVPSSTTSEESS